MKYFTIILVLLLLTTTGCVYETTSSSFTQEKSMDSELVNEDNSGVENVFDDENEVAPPSIPEE